MHEMRDLERISRSRILSTDIKLDDKYTKILETKIHTKNNEIIKIEEPHIYLKSTINDEQINTIKKFISHFFKTPNSPELDYIAKIIWLRDEVLDKLPSIREITDYEQKKFAKTIAHTAMIGHESINGHACAILRPTYGDISIIIDGISAFAGYKKSFIPQHYFFDVVSHEAFAMLNEEHVWKEYEGYQSVMSVKNDIREIREGKLWYKRENEPIYWRYRSAYELIEYLQSLKNFDYSEAQKLFFIDPPKPITLENKKNKEETILSRILMLDILYNIIFCLRKGLKIGDVKGYIEEELNKEVQAFKNDYPDYEEVDVSSNPRYLKDVVILNSYFCVFPKEEYFEFCAYAPMGYTYASAQEILKEMIDSMKISIKIFDVTSKNEVMRKVVPNFLSGKYVIASIQDLGDMSVYNGIYDGEEYYEKFMNKLLHSNLSKYRTLTDLINDVFKTLRPIWIFRARF